MAKIKKLAQEVYSILDNPTSDSSDVGDNRFYRLYLDYMTNQGYNEDITKKVWTTIENEYL